MKSVTRFVTDRRRLTGLILIALFLVALVVSWFQVTPAIETSSVIEPMYYAPPRVYDLDQIERRETWCTTPAMRRAAAAQEGIELPPIEEAQP